MTISKKDIFIGMFENTFYRAAMIISIIGWAFIYHTDNTTPSKIIGIMFGPLLILLLNYLYYQMIRNQLIDDTLYNSAEAGLNTTTTAINTEYSFYHYAKDVEQLVSLFNTAKTNKDWDNVITIGDRIVDRWNELDHYTTYLGGYRVCSAKKIGKVVKVLHKYKDSPDGLMSDIRDVISLSTETFKDKVVGVNYTVKSTYDIWYKETKKTIKNPYLVEIERRKSTKTRRYSKLTARAV